MQASYDIPCGSCYSVAETLYLHDLIISVDNIYFCQNCGQEVKFQKDDMFVTIANLISELEERISNLENKF